MDVALQRMSALVGLPALLAEYGVPLAAVTDGLDLPPGCFDSPDNRIAFRSAAELLTRAALLSECDHFGLLLGLRYDHRIMLLGNWMMAVPTLEMALTGFIAIQPAATRGGVAYLNRYGSDVIFGYGTVERYALLPTQQLVCVLAVGLNMMRGLTGGAVRPLEMLFAFRPPANADVWQRLLDLPLRFNQPENGIILSREAMQLPIFVDDQRRHEPLSDVDNELQQAALGMTMAMTMAMQVGRAIRVGILTGEVTAGQTAQRIGIHPKAMARALAAEGTSFQTLLDEVRSTTARHLLAVTDLSVGDIALSLGYANHPAFVAAFRRWTGATPYDWRVQEMASG